MTSQVVQVGMIGCGTVGTGVAKALLEKAHLLEERIGARIGLKWICDHKHPKQLKLRATRFTKDARVVLNDPDVQIVVELIGGLHPAKELIATALRSGKHVVTANKALLAESGRELFDLASRSGVDLFFEASVCGGIPIIKSLRESLLANELNAIVGIVNGTSNYILTQMREKRLSFYEALMEAKQHGYAERNPSLDIEGHDAAHKLAILAWLGFGARARLSDIHTEGISQVSQADIQYADQLGYCIKPLAIAKREENRLEVRVHPALLEKSHLLANVNGVYNAVYVHGDLIGAQLFYGRGAGQNPTASSVISDIADIARNVTLGVAGRIPTLMRASHAPRLRRMDRIETRYYLRFTVADKPGVLAQIAGILGRNKISIASVHQKERLAARIVHVVVMTHEAREANLRRALKTIDGLSTVKSKTVALRTEAPRRA